jgi:DNA-binding LacI/PurR family transcriptional regulator
MSNYFNNPALVAEDNTRQAICPAIRLAIQQAGYHPNAAAQPSSPV